MPYKLFLDKSNLFECDIQLMGASFKNSFARIIVEGKDHTYVFKGEIDQYGHCSVEINKLRSIFETNETGTIKLEVIADDVYFSPWEDNFHTDLYKKIDVVIKEQQEPSKPIISVSVKEPLKKKEEKITNKSIFDESQTINKKSTPKKSIESDENESSVEVFEIKKLLDLVENNLFLDQND